MQINADNTKYANYVIDAINPCEADELDCFQIDYRKEVFQGTQLNIYHSKSEENQIFAKCENADGDIMFACKLEYKNQGNI